MEVIFPGSGMSFDLIRTILLAMIGAIVSFGVSMAMKIMVDTYRKKHSAGR